MEQRHIPIMMPHYTALQVYMLRNSRQAVQSPPIMGKSFFWSIFQFINFFLSEATLLVVAGRTSNRASEQKRANSTRKPRPSPNKSTTAKCAKSVVPAPKRIASTWKDKNTRNAKPCKSKRKPRRNNRPVAPSIACIANCVTSRAPETTRMPRTFVAPSIKKS